MGEATPMPHPARRAGQHPERRGRVPERTGEIDVDELEAYEERRGLSAVGPDARRRQK